MTKVVKALAVGILASSSSAAVLAGYFLGIWPALVAFSSAVVAFGLLYSLGSILAFLDNATVRRQPLSGDAAARKRQNEYEMRSWEQEKAAMQADRLVPPRPANYWQGLEPQYSVQGMIYSSPCVQANEMPQYSDFAAPASMASLWQQQINITEEEAAQAEAAASPAFQWPKALILPATEEDIFGQAEEAETGTEKPLWE